MLRVVPNIFMQCIQFSHMIAAMIPGEANYRLSKNVCYHGAVVNQVMINVTEAACQSAQVRLVICHMSTM